jgi:hypothetical protein
MIKVTTAIHPVMSKALTLFPHGLVDDYFIVWHVPTVNVTTRDYIEITYRSFILDHTLFFLTVDSKLIPKNFSLVSEVGAIDASGN